MKKYAKSILVIIAALNASAFTMLSGAPDNHQAIAYPVSNAYPLSNSTVTLGLTRAEVRAYMGSPHGEIGSDVWFYNDYRADNVQEANDNGCTIIVVTFAGNKVSDIKLVNKKAIDVYVASAKAKHVESVASRK